ncbi:MAG: hypothetical protein AVDCRST_MAG40-1275, partial [uncultured Gemmatimonadaceae bacterium]
MPLFALVHEGWWAGSIAWTADAAASAGRSEEGRTDGRGSTTAHPLPIPNAGRAVELARTSRPTSRRVARDLALGTATIRRWLRQTGSDVAKRPS